MAEFVSAIIGLVAIGAKVGNSLYEVIDTIQDAPQELLGLSDEITDLRGILSRLTEALSSGELSLGDQTKDNKSLELAIAKSRFVIEDIEKLLNEAGRQRGGTVQVKRMRWLWIAKKARKYQGSLRMHKALLCNWITIGILRSSSSNGIQVARLEQKIDSLVEAQRSAMASSSNTAIIIATSGRNTQTSAPTDFTPSQEIGRKANSDSKTMIGLDTKTLVREKGQDHRDKARPEYKSTLPEDPYFATPAKRPDPVVLQCYTDCACRCHYRSIVRSSEFLHETLGELVMGCSSLPWCFAGISRCDEQSCRRSRLLRTEFKYFLPSWFGSSIARFRIDLSLKLFPLDIHLRTPNTIPYDSAILIATQEGDLNRMRELLQSGMATVDDVDPYGLGLLYYASYYCCKGSGYEKAKPTCRFLLDAGADADWVDEIGNTPIETMMDDTLVAIAMKPEESPQYLAPEFQEIAILFRQSTMDLVHDYMEDRGFSEVHRVLLRSEHGGPSLDQYFLSQHDPMALQQIDLPDSRGRSPLSWAVEYGWAEAVKTLLLYGADSRQLRISNRGASPLLHIVIAGPGSSVSSNGCAEIIKLLLHAGVDVNATDHEGWTPLHVAASWNLYDIIRLLMEETNSPLAWDALTDNGESALDLSIAGGYNAAVQYLLQNRSLHPPSYTETMLQCSSDNSDEGATDEFFDTQE